MVRRVENIDNETRERLVVLAEHYENSDFLVGDPSWFMHQVEGERNREATAFLAASLSYGSRSQFMPKIGHLINVAGGEVDKWLRERTFRGEFNDRRRGSFYRLYSYATFGGFLEAYGRLIEEYGSLGEFVGERASTGFEAVDIICRYFSGEGVEQVVPKNTTSACKRLCMFLRWMGRSGSAVDLGLWADFLDRRTLIMPLDTHVMQQARKLHLIETTTASMTTALRLTERMREVFPDDPLKGDFALFGYGVEHDNR